jgi:hypothetical protein
MTRRPTGAPGRSALYTWLREQAETDARRAWPRPTNSERLAALHAGRPVDVCAGELPDWARIGEPTHWWRRATATADGAVNFYDDDASAWLAENGL